jgi:hypothetical protein
MCESMYGSVHRLPVNVTETQSGLLIWYSTNYVVTVDREIIIPDLVS